MPPRYDANSTVAGKQFSAPATGAVASDRRSGRRASARPVTEDTEAAFAVEDAGRFHLAAQEIRAADKARDEGIGWLLVELTLRADLLHLPMGHDDQTIRPGPRPFLAV